jgi:hypothetical protein
MKCVRFFSLQLKIHPTPRPQPLLLGTIFFSFQIFSVLTVTPPSFILTPVNYFDYDVSLESRNAILVHPVEGQAGVYEFDNNGVKENLHCLPDAPPDFEYSDVGVVDLDGFVDAERTAEVRRAQDMFIRLKAVRG